MRPISETTLAILKSQNLIGQNKFSHSLRLEGVDFYSAITEIKTNTIHDNADFGDYCIRADGQVLFAYSVGTGIYLKIIQSENEMLSTSKTGTGGTLFYTLARVSFPAFSLLKLKNGKLLLIIADVGSYTNNIPYSTKAYISENGLGTDFTLKSTIYSQARYSSEETFAFHGVTKPYQMADGSIIIGAREKYVDYFDRAAVVAYKSTDNGATWVRKTFVDAYRNTILGSCFGSGNNVFIISRHDYSGYHTHVEVSTDGGENWSHNTSNFANLPFDGYGEHIIIDFAVDIAGSFFMVKSVGNNPDTLSLYKAKTTANMSYNLLNTWTNWELIQANIGWYVSNPLRFSVSDKGIIHIMQGYMQVADVRDIGLIRDEYSAPLQASSISISKGKGGANTATIQASNKDGILNPKNPDNPLFGILGTNKQIIIKQGYGTELIETFTGMIDDFDMSTWPQTTGISLRDNLKKALDQTVTYGSQHTIEFVSQPIENIIGYLCYLADIEVDIIEPTGLSVAIAFSWCSYADAFQQLGDLASFEWGCDSYGKFYFRRDYQPDNMFVAYTFEEGIDLATLKYTLSDKDIYSKVAVFGKSGETVISYEAPFLDAASYNIHPQKILKIDATEASTMDALVKIAERALSLMQSRTAVIQFTSIAIPWLEVGDFIGIYERSTGAASVYRLSDISFTMTNNSFTMSGTAYYYGDSIVPGELPTGIATQTVAPAVNLIPEMTSNVAPSGVARASSIYTSNYEPWQVFNSHSNDYYWNSITNTGWIEYQFPEKTIVDKYMLKARQLTVYNDAMPRDWKFEGFDGTKWVTLDTQTRQTNWGVYQSRTYLFVNTVAYSKYRLNTSKNDGYMRLQLEQLAMYYGGGA